MKKELLILLPLLLAATTPAVAEDLRYQGERIDLTVPKPQTHTYRVEKYLEIPGLGSFKTPGGPAKGHAGQGFTVSGDIGFFFYDAGYCRTIDLKSRKLIAEFRLPEPVANPMNHAGQANFGYEFHREGDEFPVLYLSSYLEKKCYVLRMTRTSAELVQTIYLTDGTKENGEYRLLDAQAFFIDAENDKLIIKMGAVDPEKRKYKYWKVFDLPELREGGVVHLFDEKKNDEFYVRTLKGDVPAKWNFYNAGCAQNGRIYVNAGFWHDSSSLLVIDYENHKVVTDIQWGSDLIRSNEQEQCAIYDGKLMINFNGADRLVLVTF